MEHEQDGITPSEPDVATLEPPATEGQAAPADEAEQPETLQSLLDGLSEDPPTEAAQAERGPDGRLGASETAPSDKTESQAVEPPPAAQATTAPLVPEEAEEAELLAGVHERHHARIKGILAQRNQAESHLNEIREMVNTTGMAPTDFAQLLKFGKLINAPDAASRQSALAMIETVRANLCQQLGVDAPGVDVLAEFPDLTQAVQQMELSRERAVEIAKLRRDNQAAQHYQQREGAHRQQQQQFEQALVAGQQAMTDYLSRRAQEADHPVRMKAVQDYFQQPANVQQFVTTYAPHQWASAIQLLYDAVRIAPVSAPATQPLRAKPQALGAMTPDPRLSPFEQLDQRFSAMGI